MGDQSKTCNPATSQASASAISSQASADGREPSNSPACQRMFDFGLDHAHANRFRVPASERAKWTNGTCGQSSPASSRSAALQQSLASRLRAAMDVNGSPEYVLTWKSWAMQSGPPICRLQASPRRTGEIGCSGWPNLESRMKRGGCSNLKDHVHLASGSAKFQQGRELEPHEVAAYPTPRATDGSKGGPNQRGSSGDAMLPTIAAMGAWATPNAEDAQAGQSTGRQQKSLGQDAAIASGATTGSNSQTGKRGVLNAALSCWLMGFPSSWLTALAIANRKSIESQPCVDWETR